MQADGKLGTAGDLTISTTQTLAAHGQNLAAGSATGLMTVSATGQLDNTGGKIEGNGDALVTAGTLLNNTGRIVAAQDAELKVSRLDNTEGTVPSARPTMKCATLIITANRARRAR
ncbi:hypothetical protein NC77_00095 [Janthinobacterium lividum]|uniref:hypothetical protein n=1 Tax=Janthinobacterium lividum TaxID=29581 RepID=UPI000538DD96|nr:hypothetical protein [Janthinobacterium lividum]KHA80770.1 hypothetical protein NC77_00095 [Janthinobacterium lividum]